jgi:hypothetical protein
MICDINLAHASLARGLAAVFALGTLNLSLPPVCKQPNPIQLK